MEGKYGPAASFDGSGDYVDCKDNDILDFGLGDSFTVEVWYRTSFSGQQAVVSKYKREGSDIGWWLFSNNANNPGVVFKIHASDSSNSKAWLTGTNLNDNVWHHVVGVRDVTKDKIILYVDGIEKVNVEDTTTAGCENIYPLRFGMESDTTIFPFHGAVDEVAIYNRALTPNEISQHYNKSLCHVYPTNATLTSTAIGISNNVNWSTLSLTKTEPANTCINVSILNAETNATIPGFNNLTTSNINLTPLNDLDITSIRLKAYFSGNGSATPSLDSWGVEWTAENAWRDSFTGDSKIAYPYGVDEHTVGYWTFEEGSGNVVRDLSGNENDGTLHNMDNGDWVDGVRGTALKFDGSNDYITGDDNSQFLNSDSGTIETWIKRSNGDNPSVNMPIVGKHQCSKGGGYLMINPDNQIDHSYYNVNEMRWHSLTTSDLTWNPGKWYHIMGTRGIDGLKIYRDNVLVASNADTAPFVEYGNGYLQIGTYGTFCDDAIFDGIIDEVRISDIARTPDEIRQAYQAGISIHGGQAQLSSGEYDPGADPSCVGYWSFDEGSGNTAHDGSGNGNDGTLMNNPTWVDGVRGGALEFDGENDYVDLGTQQSLSIGSSHFSCLGWVNFSETDINKVIGNRKSGNLGTLEGWTMYFNDANLRVIVEDSQGDYQCKRSIVKYNDDSWHLIAFTWNSINEILKLYVDGIEQSTIDSKSGSIDDLSSINNVTIGKAPDDISYFNGAIDEIAIYDRALSHAELSAHYNFTSGRYPTNATLHSTPIILPTDKSWSTFHCSRSVPDNTHLNVSVHDATTDEILLNNTNSTAQLYLDMMHIDPIAHPSIYLNASFSGNGSATPVLYDWAVNWTDERLFHPPSMFLPVPEIEFPEDTTASSAIDLTLHFEDINGPPFSLSYDVINLVPDGNIQAVLNGTLISFRATDENWTGCENFTINCTSEEGLYTLSNEFTVNVTPVDDPPAWITRPAMFEVMQGGTATGSHVLDDHVIDAESDPWTFTAHSDDVEAGITDDDRLRINATSDFTGNASVTVRVAEAANLSLYSDIVIPVSVLANARPEAWLVEPRNGTIVAYTAVELRWGVRDIDSPAENITFDLYFGPYQNISLRASDILFMNYTVEDLAENVTYCWCVTPRDETGFGRCLNDTWHFTVNTSKEIPLVSYLYPEDGITINTTSVNLSWKPLDLLDENLSYEVYLGTVKDDDELARHTVTSNEFCTVNNLSDNTTYYWKIVPWAGKLKGRSVSGVWSFSVDRTFVPIYNLSWSIDESTLTVEKGTTLSFGLTIRNVGNTINAVTIDKIGILANNLALSRTLFTLKPNMNNTTVVNLFTYELDVGNHTIVFLLVHRGGTDRIEIPVEVTDKVISPEETEENPESGGYLIPAIISVVILTLVIIALFIILKRRKRKNKNEEGGIDEDAGELYEADISDGTVEADIVHVPAASGKFAPPPVDDTNFRAAPIPSMNDANAQAANMQAAPIPPQDPRYQFRGPWAEMPLQAPAPGGDHPSQFGAPPLPIPGGADDAATPPPDRKKFDTSGLHIPDESPFAASPVYGQGAFLALPPARYIDVTEEDKIVPIDELFLMTNSGLLVQHYSLKRESGLNEDVLASMLTAVKSFILDSLSMVGEENVEERDLSIDLGKFTVMMAAGRSLNLVAITSRDKKEQVRKQLEKGASVLDVIFGDILANWDGDMSKLEGVKPYIESLVKGKFDDEAIKGMEKPLPPPEEPPVLPTPPEKGPELDSGRRSVTVSLPDPVKLPDTTRALPEKSEVPLRATLEEPKGADILAALDDILIDMPGSVDSGGGVAEPVSPVAGLPVPDDLFRITMDGENPPPPPGR